MPQTKPSSVRLSDAHRSELGARGLGVSGLVGTFEFYRRWTREALRYLRGLYHSSEYVLAVVETLENQTHTMGPHELREHLLARAELAATVSPALAERLRYVADGIRGSRCGYLFLQVVADSYWLGDEDTRARLVTWPDWETHEGWKEGEGMESGDLIFSRRELAGGQVLLMQHAQLGIWLDETWALAFSESLGMWSIVPHDDLQWDSLPGHRAERVEHEGCQAWRIPTGRVGTPTQAVAVLRPGGWDAVPVGPY